MLDDVHLGILNHCQLKSSAIILHSLWGKVLNVSHSVHPFRSAGSPSLFVPEKWESQF